MNVCCYKHKIQFLESNEKQLIVVISSFRFNSRTTSQHNRRCFAIVMIISLFYCCFYIFVRNKLYLFVVFFSISNNISFLVLINFIFVYASCNNSEIYSQLIKISNQRSIIFCNFCCC